MRGADDGAVGLYSADLGDLPDRCLMTEGVPSFTAVRFFLIVRTMTAGG